MFTFYAEPDISIDKFGEELFSGYQIEQKGYAHLNFYQSCSFKWNHSKTWIQQNNNVKGIIGITISTVISALIKYYFFNLIFLKFFFVYKNVQ